MIGAIIAKKKARFGFDALNRHALDEFMALWADDATYIFPGTLSISGETKGKKAISDVFRKYLDLFPFINFTIKKVFVENIFALGSTNVLAVEWDVQFYNQEGAAFQNSGVTIIHIEKGKVVLIHEYIFDIELEKKAWGEG